MDLTTHNTAFAQGIQKQLVKCAYSGMTKSALNPRIIEKVLYDARRTPELAALGQSVFARSYHQPNPAKGLFMTGLAGYGQLRNLHAIRLDHIKEIAGLRRTLGRAAPGSSEYNWLSSQIADKMRNFQSTKRTGLAELGAVVEPRLKFLRTTVPAVGAGAAGVGAGALVGNASGTNAEKNDVAGAPVGSRLQYLLNPSILPSTPTPGEQSSSATDSGNQ